MRLTSLSAGAPRTAHRRLSARAAMAAAVGAALLVPGATAANAGDGVEGGDVTITVEGTLERLIVDLGDGSAHADDEPETTHVVTMVDVDGDLVTVPDAVAVDGQTGDDVVVTVAADASLTVEQAMEVVTVPEIGDQARIVTVEPSEPQAAPTSDEAVLGVALGGHALTVLPVYWGAPDVSVSTLQGVASTTAQYWYGQSGGRINVASSVRSWVQIADPGSCNTTALWNAALDAHGIDRNASSATNHILVYFPKRNDCGGWAGQASVGGGRIWVNGSVVPDVMAHELGHNFGLGHAELLTCPASAPRVPLAAFSSCTKTAYGDYADVMGIGMNMATGNLNTAFADYLGFAAGIDASSVPGGGTVTLAPLASVGSMRALRVPVADGTVFFDYRPAVGPDVRKPGWAGVQVHLRRIESGGIPYTYLLDMKAGTGTPFTSPSLALNSSWSVPGTAVGVTTTGLDSTARLTVGVGTDPVTSYVTRVYRDLFGRGVDPAGLAGWSAALHAGTPRIAVANSITYSDEYRLTLIAESYQRYLGRGPDSAGHLAWLAAMRAGVTIQQMESGFLASDEYYAQGGGTDAGWVSRLYQHVLGRPASAGEIQGWVQALAAGGSRQAASMGFLLSTEHLGDVVNVYYLDLLGRGIDPTGRSQWVAAVQSGTRVEAIIGGIIASDEYYNKA